MSSSDPRTWSWPELMIFGSFMLGILLSPVLALHWLYGFVRRVIAHAQRGETTAILGEFASLAGRLIIGVIIVYIWAIALGIDLPPFRDPLPGGDR